MKLTVLTWLKENAIVFVGRAIELLFRSILCLLPLGVYMLILQKRKKASTINTISVYTKEYSRWQHIFPGFILVTVEPESLNTFIAEIHNNIQKWIERNKYLLAFLFMSAIVGLMLLSYVKGG
jgi:hypothetical protein